MRQNMRIFKKKSKTYDPLEERLDIISDLTRDLERKEFNCLMDAIKSMFEARQKLKGVKTKEEKEVQIVDDIAKDLIEETNK